MELNVISFDQGLISAVSGDQKPAPVLPGLSFERNGEFKADAPYDPFFTTEAFDGLVAKRLAKAVAGAAGVPVGVAVFENVHVHARTGMIADLAQRQCYKGHLLNMTDNALGQIVAKNLAWGNAARSSVVIEAGEAAGACINLPSAVLAAGPGYNIYGHWLLDFLPRLFRVRSTDFAASPIIRLPEKGWAQKLGNYFLDGALSAHAVEPAPWYFVEKLIVPTVARYNHALHAESLMPAWTLLKDVLLADAGPAAGEPARHVFVSRRKLKRKVREERRILNIGAVERAAEEAGFAVVSPETLSLPEQARLFSNAEVIVGEDGSGLHNCIFAKAGTRIGVLGPRGNVLHASIAAITKQKVHYINTVNRKDEAREDGATRIPINKFKAALDALLG